MYDAGHSQRAISLGMAKMGLPDLVVEDLAQHSQGEIGNLINLVSQALAEGQAARKTCGFRLALSEIRDAGIREEMMKALKPNSTGVACLTLLPGKWEDGDPHNRLVQLAFDKYPGPDLHARQEAMIDSFFGFADSVHYVKHDDALLAASAEARQQLPALHKALEAFQPGEYLEVKAPFRTESGGNEWMWVEVRRWEGNRISGLLDNEPEAVPGLHAGQEVEVRQEDIFDYLHKFPDKRTEGNKTGMIMKNMQETKKPGTPDFKPIVPPCNVN